MTDPDRRATPVEPGVGAGSSRVRCDNLRDLERAVARRQVIGQGVEIFMERQRISATDAFDALVTASPEWPLPAHSPVERSMIGSP